MIEQLFGIRHSLQIAVKEVEVRFVNIIFLMNGLSDFLDQVKIAGLVRLVPTSLFVSELSVHLLS
jgi:hypothetical protein